MIWNPSPQEYHFQRTSRLQLNCAASQKLLDLLWFDRLPRPRILPLFFWQGECLWLLDRVLLGLGGLGRAILALESGEKASHFQNDL